MMEFFLCITSGCLLIWVVYLKLEISALTRDQKKIMGLLKNKVETMTGDVEITTVLRGWGKRAHPEEEEMWVMKRDTAATKPNRVV